MNMKLWYTITYNTYRVKHDKVHNSDIYLILVVVDGQLKSTVLIHMNCHLISVSTSREFTSW